MNENCELILRFFEDQVNLEDTSQYAKFVAKNVIVHGPGSDQTTQGLQNVEKIDVSYCRAYPKKKFAIEEIFEQGDRVFLRWICKGLYKDEWKGIRLKKPIFGIAGISIYRIEKGKIAEIWQYWDRLGLLEQMGEIRVHRDPIEPGYYLDILKSLGMKKYVEGVPFLTERERHCLLCLLQGKTAKETASLYKLSYRTVESYYEKIKKKLNCPTKRDLFTVAQTLEKLELL